jgi:hypothetical protein
MANNPEFRHALVGWYLMMPPLQSDLDSSCKPGAAATIRDFIQAWSQSITSDIAQRRRCDLESTLVVDDAPLSKWKQIDSFEALSTCQAWDAPYSPTDEENQASLAKLLVPAWGKEAHHMAGTVLEAGANQKMDKRCIASDDPRLKGN